MNVQPLLYTLATNAAGTVAGNTAGTIGKTVSFADALRRAAAEQVSAPLEKSAENEPPTGESNSPLDVETAPSGVTTYLEEIRRVAESARQKLLEEFRHLARDANLDPATEFSLQLDGNGTLQALSDDPDAREIEQLAAQDPQTAKLITDWLDANRVLTAAEEYPSFYEAYQRDPLLAVAEYSHLFDGAEEPVFTISPAAGELYIAR